jgi:hypothetical protein
MRFHFQLVVHEAQLAGRERVSVPVPLERPDQRPVDLGAST